jgi:hypothetical protein
VDGGALSFFLDLPRPQRSRVVSYFWRNTVKELSSHYFDVNNELSVAAPSSFTGTSTELCLTKLWAAASVNEQDVDMVDGCSLWLTGIDPLRQEPQISLESVAFVLEVLVQAVLIGYE